MTLIMQRPPKNGFPSLRAPRFHYLHPLKGLTTAISPMQEKKKKGIVWKINPIIIPLRENNDNGRRLPLNAVLKKRLVGSCWMKSYLSSSGFIFCPSLNQILPHPVTLLIALLMLHYKKLCKATALCSVLSIFMHVSKDRERMRERAGEMDDLFQ